MFAVEEEDDLRSDIFFTRIILDWFSWCISRMEIEEDLSCYHEALHKSFLGDSYGAAILEERTSAAWEDLEFEDAVVSSCEDVDELRVYIVWT